RLSRLDWSRFPEETTRIKLRLQALRESRDGLFAQKAGPSASSSSRVEPPAPGALQAALDPGTALLAYSLDEHQTLLFVLQPARALTVISLPIDALTLAREVADFRALLQDPAESPRAIKTKGAQLYDQ